VGVGPSLADERGFVHKKIFGGIKGAIGGLIGGGPGGVVGGAFRGFAGGGKPPVNVVPQQTGCPPGFFFNVNTQRCVPATPFAGGRKFGGVPTGINLPFVEPPGVGLPLLGGGRVSFGEFNGGAADEFGPAKMGRFGAGMEPAIRETSTRICPRGAVLGQDGLCYNRRDLRNSERFWPRGRRPLLTGGEMRCITIASSAAKKLQRKQKQLEGLGLLKKPSRGRRALPAGHVAQIKHG